jgi:hypothetical protein
VQSSLDKQAVQFKAHVPLQQISPGAQAVR